MTRMPSAAIRLTAVLLPILLFLSPLVAAQSPSTSSEVVYASVVLVRTGERTPFIEQYQNATKLTPSGAQQVYSLGASFRERYITSQNTSNPSTAISGLSPHEVDSLQLYLLAQDTQYNDATAQAFIQSLYPPYPASNSSGSSSPTAGYQYPWIHAASENDPESIYADGSSTCAAFANDATYFNTNEFSNTVSQSSDLYQRVGQALAGGNMSEDRYTYNNAYAVWDYVSYEYAHNRTVQAAFNTGNLTGALQQLRYYSDQFQWATYGTADSTHVSRIAGQTFAYAVLERLGLNIQSKGTSAKLSVLFSEFPAFVSFASLLNLQKMSTNFRGLPEFGSSLVMELFANKSSQYPDPGDLQVRLLFRNGTNASSSLTTYSMGR